MTQCWLEVQRAGMIDGWVDVTWRRGGFLGEEHIGAFLWARLGNLKATTGWEEGSHHEGVFGCDGWWVGRGA